MLFQFKTKNGKFAITSYRRVQVSPTEYHIFLTSPNTNLESHTICCDELTSKIVLSYLDDLTFTQVITEEELMFEVSKRLERVNAIRTREFLKQYGL